MVVVSFVLPCKACKAGGEATQHIISLLHIAQGH